MAPSSSFLGRHTSSAGPAASSTSNHANRHRFTHHAAETGAESSQRVNSLLPHRRIDAFDTELAQSQLQPEHSGKSAQTMATHSKDHLASSSGSTQGGTSAHPPDNRLSAPNAMPQLTSRSSSRLQVVANTVKASHRFESMHDWRRTTPGIDPNKVDLPHLKTECVIQAVDCSKDSATFRVLDNNTLAKFLKESRPPGTKLRYINVNGLDWQVIKNLALHYGLHPLSIEDMLHHDNASGVRSKVDYLSRHLFMSLLVHKLASHPEDDEDDDDSEKSLHSTTSLLTPSSANQTCRDEEMVIETPGRVPSGHDVFDSTEDRDEDDITYLDHANYTKDLDRAFKSLQYTEARDRGLNHTASSSSEFFRKRNPRSKLAKLKRSEGKAARWTVAQLTKDASVDVSVEQLGVFLLDGTVISFTQDPGFHPQISSVFDRMASRDDLIRDSEDSSMIVHAILDVIVDDGIEVVDEFRDRLTRLEARVLSSPDLDDVRHLHILSAQLLLLKSTFSPLQLLISSLRTQDEAKYAATLRPPNSSSASGRSVSDRKGYMSHQAKLYLGDVLDHIESVISNLELFGDMAENLISYAFNASAAASNSYIQALSVLSSCFLPLTFLSSFYGMNFGSFPHVLDGDVSYFWKSAAPVTVLTTILFSWTYIRSFIIGFKRDLVRWNHQRLATKRE